MNFKKEISKINKPSSFYFSTRSIILSIDLCVCCSLHKKLKINKKNHRRRR